MGKNKSKRRARTDWAMRVSALRKLDNELAKQSKYKSKGDEGHGRKAESVDND